MTTLHRPELYVFEGGDACGKATQSKLLASALETEVLDFPSYSRTPAGRMVDDLLHFSKEDRATLAKLFPRAANDLPFARLVQYAQTWDRLSCTDLWAYPKPKLVLDRYVMSGFVFGSILDGLPMSELLQSHRELPAPTRAFLLDVPVEVQMERLQTRGRVPDIYEAREGLKTRLTKIREGYQTVWQTYGPAMWPTTAWIVLDGSLSAQEVHRDVIDTIDF